MKIKLLLTVLLGLIIIFPAFGHSQGKEDVAQTFAVRIFSSANFLGYLEPCG